MTVGSGIGLLLCACQSPIGNEIIPEYKRASCLVFSHEPKIHPPTREWDTTLTLKSGVQVVVTGFDAVGGIVTLRDVASGKRWIAVNPGDYIYPNDIRIDSQREYLYVRASGLAGGINQETWLFEYDLNERRLLRKERVAEKALSPICSESNHSLP